MDTLWSCVHGVGCQKCAQLDKHIRDGEDRDRRQPERGRK